MWGTEVNKESNITGLKPKCFWVEQPEGWNCQQGLGHSDLRGQGKENELSKETDKD